MSELLSKLGIDKWLLLSQAVNFLILVAALRAFVYKPLLKVMKERRGRIEEGLAKADEAENRLHEANEAAKDRMKAAEEEAMGILRNTEEKAKKLEAELMGEARKKEAAMLAGAELAAKAKEEEAAGRLRAEAGNLIRTAIVKAVGMRPEAVDDAMITKAVEEMKRA